MGRMITKTLAEIYFQQGHLQEAYKIFIALSKKDPLDKEIQERLKELGEKLSLSPSPIHQPVHSAEKKIRLLEEWLANIRKRRRG